MFLIFHFNKNSLIKKPWAKFQWKKLILKSFKKSFSNHLCAAFKLANEEKTTKQCYLNLKHSLKPLLIFFFVSGILQWPLLLFTHYNVCLFNQHHLWMHLLASELQSDRHPSVLSIWVGIIFLCLIAIYSPARFTCRGIIRWLHWDSNRWPHPRSKWLLRPLNHRGRLLSRSFEFQFRFKKILLLILIPINILRKNINSHCYSAHGAFSTSLCKWPSG